MDRKLEPPYSYVVVLLPLLLIAVVVGVVFDWDWRAFVVPALFIAALIPYVARKK